MKKQKKEKKTLYATLIEQFIEAGYKVEEGSWVETVGYDKPTTEYWFDVVYKEKENVVYTLHYWFCANLDKLSKVECFTHEIVTKEVNHKKIF